MIRAANVAAVPAWGTESATSEAPAAPAGRPIDLGHLSRQTMGDRALEREVLVLFTEQAVEVRDTIERASEDERRRLAHGLRGSAGGIGAFAIAICATDLEHNPALSGGVQRLQVAIDDALTFIAALAR